VSQFKGNGSFNQKFITTVLGFEARGLQTGQPSFDAQKGIRILVSVHVSTAYPIFSPTVNGSPHSGKGSQSFKLTNRFRTYVNNFRFLRRILVIWR
jgi:hypothetical protein